MGRETYSEMFLGVLLEAGLGSKQLIYEPPIPLIVVPLFEGEDTLSSSRPFSSETVNVVLEECDLELWTVETGEGEKHSRINLLKGPEQIKPNFPQISTSSSCS